MKKITSLLIGLTLCAGMTLFLFDGCKKKDDTPVETCSDGVQNQGETGIDCGGPCPACAAVVTSPCTGSLTDNKVASSTTPGLNGLTASKNGNEISASSADGDIYIKFGSTIAAGNYPLEQNTAPNPGKALIDYRPVFQGNYLSTSGTIYVADKGTTFSIEFCSINCNSTSSSTAVTGRVVVNK